MFWMGKEGKRKIGECAYCAEQSEVSKDHIIPRCLFPRPLPVNMEPVSVYACDACNNEEKSKNDQFLRDMLVCDIWNSGNPLAQEAYQAMLRSVKKNRSVVARMMISQGFLEPIVDPDGRIKGYGYRVELDAESKKRINDIFAMIIRGIYYKTEKKQFPRDYQIQVTKLEPQEYLDVYAKLQELDLDHPYRIADGVFTLTRGFLVNDIASGFFLLSFYDAVFFHVSTKPSSTALS